MRLLSTLPLLIASHCSLQTGEQIVVDKEDTISTIEPITYEPGSWEHFLQNLPTYKGDVVDYSGKAISNQQKHVAIVKLDVGNKDLQQCADALIRLRAEYLFSRKRYEEIEFHFTSGDLYRFKDYLKGKRPLINRNKVVFRYTSPLDVGYRSLKAYLEIVYAYAGTISLANKLKTTNQLKVGTIIITGGSPGHCSMIVDEAKDGKGNKIYKLAESYTPAQSIYILKNPVDGTAWYQLKTGTTIETSSYVFKNYRLVSFE